MFRHPETYPVIAVDTETNGYDVRDGRGLLYGLSVCSRFPGIGYLSAYVPIHHPEYPPALPSVNLGRDEFFELKEAIEAYTGVIVFHNAKFDLESLMTVGIKYTGRFVDTMLWAHLLNENFPFSKSLDACTKHYLKDPGKKNEGEFKVLLGLYGWEGMPAQAIIEYAEYDTVLTFALYEALLPLMEKEDILEYWFNHKAKFLNVVRAMERRGVFIDVAMCKRMTIYGESIMEDIKEILGLNPGSTKDLEKLLIQELGLPLVKPTKGTAKLPKEEWKPSFDKEAMEVYDRILELKEDETAVHILTYRGWQKAVSSNYKPYVELLSPDGRLRPNYKLHGTRTGRSSCEKPNLQQIPREGEKAWNGEMKTAFLPEQGFSLWEFDYGQLELRLGTGYAKEDGLKNVFEAGRDIFTEMSLGLGMSRQQTKTLTYTIQYGGGINRISQVFGVSADRAGSIRDNYYATYPGFRQVSSLAQAKTKHKGKIRLWSGRYRHFQYPKDEAHKAFNSVIQGGAADIVETQMIRLFEEVDNDEECRMLLTVHDSVVFEIKNGMEEYYHPKIKAIMEDVKSHDGQSFGVRFAVDCKKFGDKD